MYSGEVSLSSSTAPWRPWTFLKSVHTLDENDRHPPAHSNAGPVCRLGRESGRPVQVLFHRAGLPTRWFSPESKDLGVELGIGSGPPTVLNAVVGTTIGRDLTSEVDLRSWMAKDGSILFLSTSEIADSSPAGMSACATHPRRRHRTPGGEQGELEPSGRRHLLRRTCLEHRELKLTESIADNTDGNWRPELMKPGVEPAGTMDDPGRRHRPERTTPTPSPTSWTTWTVRRGPRRIRGPRRKGRATPSAIFRAQSAQPLLSGGCRQPRHHQPPCHSAVPDVSEILKGTKSEVETGLDGFDLVQGKLVNQSVAKSWLRLPSPRPTTSTSSMTDARTTIWDRGSPSTRPGLRDPGQEHVPRVVSMTRWPATGFTKDP